MAEIRSGGPSWWSLLAILIGIGIIGWLTFSATNKSDDTSYTKGATHNETTTNIAPVANYFPLSVPGCSPFVRIDERSGAVIPKVDKKEVKK